MKKQQTYNPDVLNCLANLSNDEVFTPPALANQVLDMLPQELFSNPKTKFLDPVSKSGVFLREIVKRLDKGLAHLIPDNQQRIDHIMHNQVYGVAITELTSHISRRSLYCSMRANSEYSVSHFANPEGNVQYKALRHTWVGGKCKYCGASQEVYDRSDADEQYAYQFIHTDKPERLFNNMKFDVIIGNPPYQLDTGSTSRQAKPLYNLFIDQAKRLNPRFLTMIIPSRWFAGGMGLDDFRDSIKKDKRIKCLVDYTNAKDCFPQNSISGGVCYFLWERDYRGLCSFTSCSKGESNTMLRPLDEFNVLVRYNYAISIIHKVRKFSPENMCSEVSSISPFALGSDFRGKEQPFDNSIRLHCSKGVNYIDPSLVKKGSEWLGKYKVMISQTGAEHAMEPGSDGRFRVLTSSMKVIGKTDVCTHSYILACKFDVRERAENLLTYLKTNFVRFLILQCVSSIHISKSVFEFVPLQDFSHPWTDDMLYKKYNLDEKEIAFIESMIRPME